jgi:hypothetical protein
LSSVAMVLTSSWMSSRKFSRACWVISSPRSQVSDFASCFGRRVIAAPSASATASAW